jgi:peptide/nickel transport system substrate-binding protein
MSNASSAATSVPKFGYVPVTFPRDVALVNQFAEHVILGQILEPLVDADRFGSMTRGIAESWSVSADGKTLTFKIGANQHFSNGKPVGPKDIKYSIDRHLKEKTQSSNFVRSIKEVKIKGESEIEITLTEPNVAILKALTRDHLGIVPEGWKFESASNEPIIGSGPYRLLRKNGKWFLVKNERYSKAAAIPISEWELVFFKNEALDLPEGVIPDGLVA